MRKNYPQNQRHSLAIQLIALQRDFPDGRGTIQKSHLIWICDILPNPLCRTYTIRLTYRLGKNPTTQVIKPSLKALAGDRIIPHLYSQEDETLCLFLPWSSEWSENLFLSKTIIPWAHTWFLYFEHWIATDEWLGGGVHPSRKYGVMLCQLK